MAGQSAMSTPIFDELLREMTSRENDPGPPARTPAPPPANPAPDQNRAQAGRGRRHRAD